MIQVFFFFWGASCTVNIPARFALVTFAGRARRLKNPTHPQQKRMRRRRLRVTLRRGGGTGPGPGPPLVGQVDEQRQEGRQRRQQVAAVRPHQLPG